MKKIARLKTAKKSSRLPLSSVFQIRETCLFRVEDSCRITIMNLEDEEVYSILGIAAYIWCLLDGKHTIEEAINKCQKDFKISDPAYSERAMEFLEDIFEKNLVKEIKKKSRESSADLTKRLNKSLLDMDISKIKKLRRQDMKARMAYQVAGATSS